MQVPVHLGQEVVVVVAKVGVVLPVVLLHVGVQLLSSGLPLAIGGSVPEILSQLVPTAAPVIQTRIGEDKVVSVESLICGLNEHFVLHNHNITIRGHRKLIWGTKRETLAK